MIYSAVFSEVLNSIICAACCCFCETVIFVECSMAKGGTARAFMKVSLLS
jgi:hypothetical protein